MFLPHRLNVTIFGWTHSCFLCRYIYFFTSSNNTWISGERCNMKIFIVQTLNSDKVKRVNFVGSSVCHSAWIGSMMMHYSKWLINEPGTCPHQDQNPEKGNTVAVKTAVSHMIRLMVINKKFLVKISNYKNTLSTVKGGLPCQAAHLHKDFPIWMIHLTMQRCTTLHTIIAHHTMRISITDHSSM